MKLPRQIEMTTTRADFVRLLPAAVGHVDFIDQGDAFTHQAAGRNWRIGFAGMPELRIGLIRLERHRVEFSFNGFSEAEIDAFLARFELHFRRGGG